MVDVLMALLLMAFKGFKNVNFCSLELCVFKCIHTQNYVNLENDVISIFAHLASASSVDDEERKLKDKEKYCQ